MVGSNRLPSFKSLNQMAGKGRFETSGLMSPPLCIDLGERISDVRAGCLNKHGPACAFPNRTPTRHAFAAPCLEPCLPPFFPVESWSLRSDIRNLDHQVLPLHWYGKSLNQFEICVARSLRQVKGLLCEEVTYDTPSNTKRGSIVCMSSKDTCATPHAGASTRQDLNSYSVLRGQCNTPFRHQPSLVRDQRPCRKLYLSLPSHLPLASLPGNLLGLRYSPPSSCSPHLHLTKSNREMKKETSLPRYLERNGTLTPLIHLRCPASSGIAGGRYRSSGRYAGAVSLSVANMGVHKMPRRSNSSPRSPSKVGNPPSDSRGTGRRCFVPASDPSGNFGDVPSCVLNSDTDFLASSDPLPDKHSLQSIASFPATLQSQINALELDLQNSGNNNSGYVYGGKNCEDPLTLRLDNSTLLGFPQDEEDIAKIIREIPRVSTHNIKLLHDSLTGHLSNIRRVAMEGISETKKYIRMESKFRNFSDSDIRRRLRVVSAKFRLTRSRVLQKFEGYARNRRWIENVATRQRRGRLTHSQNNTLRLWLFTYFRNPYPDNVSKEKLMEETNLSMTQVSNWLINARSRVWKPTLDSLSAEGLRGAKTMLQLNAARRDGDVLLEKRNS